MNASGPTVVDVRTREEFEGGHVPGSVNVPLNEIPERMEEIRSMPKPVILCCRSGARSENALRFLEHAGLTDLENGGPWQSVLNRLSQK